MWIYNYKRNVIALFVKKGITDITKVYINYITQITNIVHNISISMYQFEMA